MYLLTRFLQKAFLIPLQYKQRLLSRPLIWCSESWYYHLSSLEECFFHRHRYGMTPARVKIHQREVQWKQGVVFCMILHTSSLRSATPIHCTPLRLHPPLMNTHMTPARGYISLSLYIYIYAYVYIHIYIYIHTHTCVHANIYIYIYIYTRLPARAPAVR